VHLTGLTYFFFRAKQIDESSECQQLATQAWSGTAAGQSFLQKWKKDIRHIHRVIREDN
jgi:hypothetical protein